MLEQPRRYRKRPLEIEAMRFDGGNGAEIFGWVASMEDPPFMRIEPGRLVIRTTTGDATVLPGWWVCKGIEDELYPCKPSIFEATYEALDA